MNFEKTSLDGIFIIEPLYREDERGSFSRIFCRNEFQQIGHTKDFVQFNHSVNMKKGTLRGLHYQEPPHMETKLIKCIRGRIFDVAVDIRRNSSSYLHWTGTEISASNRKMIYIPEGFAHGFITLEDHSELMYFHTGYHHPLSEKGLLYNDEQIGIEWPEQITCISERDRLFQTVSQSSFKGILI